jgi:hypothetical protein
VTLVLRHSVRFNESFINRDVSPSGHSGSDLGLTLTDIFRSLQLFLQATAAVLMNRP